MAKRESGYLIFINDGDEIPDVVPEIVPIESDFGKIRKEAERIAAELSLPAERWDVCTGDGRYLAIGGWKKLECWLTDNIFDFQDDYYVYDIVGKRWTDDFTWEQRDEAALNREDALLLLSMKMTQDFGGVEEDDLEEMEVFAKKWKIPFSAELFSTFDDMFNEQNPHWNSSSVRC